MDLNSLLGFLGWVLAVVAISRTAVLRASIKVMERRIEDLEKFKNDLLNK